jgi:hypothetical protein
MRRTKTRKVESLGAWASMMKTPSPLTRSNSKMKPVMTKREIQMMKEGQI